MTTALQARRGALRPLERSGAAANWLLDLVFPAACSACGRVDSRFCAGCANELARVPVESRVHQSQAGQGLDAVLATGKHDGVLRSAVRSFKYDGARELAAPLAGRLVQVLRRANWAIDAIVPTPLFAAREAERGYNQAALLSQQVALALDAPIRGDFLWRTRETSQQAGLSAEAREQNVKDCFAASHDVSGLAILLVDDVVTTGSTLRECAVALKAERASKIYGIAVSHA